MRSTLCYLVPRGDSRLAGRWLASQTGIAAPLVSPAPGVARNR